MNEGPVQIAPLKTLNWLDQATDADAAEDGLDPLRFRELSALSFQFGDSEDRTQYILYYP